jgi:hypothetical protein
VADRLATDGAGSGTYSDCRMTGLEPDTVYHVRAWASNREGTAYGPELSFNSGKILGSGFGGGLVFYNDGAGHGLVAAAENQSKPTIVWWLANQKKDTKATATGIGSGAANTARIVAALGDTSFTAGGLAKSYRGGGFADWFLPSQEELKLMFANLHARGLGGFSNNYYWSSSAQTGRFPAFAQNFGDPDRSIDATAYGLDFCVRAARAF